METARQLVEQKHEVCLLMLVVPTLPPSKVKSMYRAKRELTRALKGHPSELAQIADAHYEARYRYIPKKYPGRIVYYEATEDPVEDKDNIRREWEGLAEDGLELQIIPGDHNSSVREPLVQGLAEKLIEYLGS
jgi:thioesterase domain-containing protein